MRANNFTVLITILIFLMNHSVVSMDCPGGAPDQEREDAYDNNPYGTAFRQYLARWFAVHEIEMRGLVSMPSFDPTVFGDIRYATKNNFTGKQIYRKAKCYLLKNVAQALSIVQKELRAQHNVNLQIWDGYRPRSAQQALWDACADRYPDEKEREQYVSNPAKGGRHTRGTAVDVTLVDMQGNELPMPSDFDDFSQKARSDYDGCSAEAKKNRALLRHVMEKHGFNGIKTEWWHFDYQGWENCPPLNCEI